MALTKTRNAIGDLAEGAQGQPRRGALAALSLSVLLPSLATSTANIGLPTLMRSFGASFSEIQWVVLAYLISVTALIVSIGRLGDIIGPRRLLVAGTFIFTVASAFCAASSELWQLIAARAVQGAGAAAMLALAMALVGESVPKDMMGRSMGLLGTMSAVGTTLGPSLGGAVISAFGWPAMFLVNVPLGIVASFLAVRFLPEGKSGPRIGRRDFDLVGTLLLTFTLVAYALAMTLGRGDFGLKNAIMLAAAAFGVGLFMFFQRRTSSPLIRHEMFQRPALTAGLAMTTLVSTVMMATLVVGPFYLSRALYLDTAYVGFVVSVGPLVAALFGLPAGQLVDHLGPHRTTVVGLAVMMAGSVVLALMQPALGVLGYVTAIGLVTAGYALFQAANNTAVMSDIRHDQRGVISGLLNLSRNLGLITGTSVMGAIFALASSSSDINQSTPETVVNGMRATFGVAALIIAAALAVGTSHFGPRRGRKES